MTPWGFDWERRPKPKAGAQKNLHRSPDTGIRASGKGVFPTPSRSRTMGDCRNHHNQALQSRSASVNNDSGTPEAYEKSDKGTRGTRSTPPDKARQGNMWGPNKSEQSDTACPARRDATTTHKSRHAKAHLPKVSGKFGAPNGMSQRNLTAHPMAGIQ